MSQTDEIHQQRRERRASIIVPVQIVIELRVEAKRRRMMVDELAAQILKNVVADDLYAAVIDR